MGASKSLDLMAIHFLGASPTLGRAQDNHRPARHFVAAPVVNVVDLFRLRPSTEHPHGLAPRDFDSLFTTNKPVIFNFHGYPWLIHLLTYRHTNHANLHVRGYKEKGNINTPLELAIKNHTDRFNLAIDAIDRVPRLQLIGAHVKEWLKDQIIDNINFAHENGMDRPEIVNWRWPGF